MVPDQVEKGYAVFCRNWKQETTIQADFEMKAQFVGANPKIHYDLGRAAMTRGPLVYCLEEADNGPRLDELVLNTEAGIRETAVRSGMDMWSWRQMLSGSNCRRGRTFTCRIVR